MVYTKEFPTLEEKHLHFAISRINRTVDPKRLFEVSFGFRSLSFIAATTYGRVSGK